MGFLTWDAFKVPETHENEGFILSLSNSLIIRNTDYTVVISELLYVEDTDHIF